MYRPVYKIHDFLIIYRSIYNSLPLCPAIPITKALPRVSMHENSGINVVCT